MRLATSGDQNVITLQDYFLTSLDRLNRDFSISTMVFAASDLMAS